MLKALTVATTVLTLTATSAMAADITEADVREAQKEWADGIVAISQAYIDEGDYKARAEQHIKDLYAYGDSEVLFKPTLASQDQFRETYEQALSYFVGGEVAEDAGFAIKPWTAVRFGEQEILTQGDTALAMGNYYFTPQGSDEEQKVEFTFHYMQDENGDLKINAHHSSLPYQPEGMDKKEDKDA